MAEVSALWAWPRSDLIVYCRGAAIEQLGSLLQTFCWRLNNRHWMVNRQGANAFSGHSRYFLIATTGGWRKKQQKVNFASAETLMELMHGGTNKKQNSIEMDQADKRGSARSACCRGRYMTGVSATVRPRETSVKRGNGVTVSPRGQRRTAAHSMSDNKTIIVKLICIKWQKPLGAN